MSRKDIDRNRLDLIWGTILAFAWSGWGNPQKASVNVADLWAEILTQELLNTKQGLYSFDCDAWLCFANWLVWCSS